ncbi:MAG: squalene/phytoene synthase family protein [Pseudomonadota bacterium]
MAKAEISYCGQLVKQHDPDRFLLSMFAPSSVREDLWALFAFNYEIAKTREVVSETQLGLIRLQWWRERIAEIYEGKSVPENEVLKALAGAIERHGLSQEDLEMLLHAREFDLEDVLPGNVEGLLNYTDFTTTPLMKMAVEISGGPGSDPVQAVAVNSALAGILRSTVFFAKQRRCYLPEDLLKAHGQSVSQLYELKPAEGLPAVVREVAEQAVSGVKCDNRFLRATDKLAGTYLKQLKGVGYDVFHPKLLLEPAFKALRLVF